GGPRAADRMGGGGRPGLREPERDGVLRGELPADEGPWIRDETRALLRRQGSGPRRTADPRATLEDDRPLLHERLQGRLAAPVAHQAARRKCRATLGRRDGGRDPREGDPRGSRPGTADARSRGPSSGAEGPHGPR